MFDAVCKNIFFLFLIHFLDVVDDNLRDVVVMPSPLSPCFCVSTVLSLSVDKYSQLLCGSSINSCFTYQSLPFKFLPDG